ncbi:hypothetical protein ACLESO_43635 [Pyxidicoccus sp. 3LG]
MPTKPTVALLTLLCGCSSTARISRINGEPIEARIHRSNNETLFLRTEWGPDVALPRSEVVDIDHPGNGVAVAGGILSAYGALNIAAGLETCSELGGAYCVGTFLPAAIGVPMLIWGLTTWGNSTSAAANNSKPAYSGVVPSPPSTSPFDFALRKR